MRVDVVVAARLAPHKRRVHFHKRQPHGHRLVQEAHQHARLAKLQALYQSAFAHIHEAVLQRLIDRTVSDVALRAVSKSRLHFDLHFVLRLVQNELGGRDGEPGHFRGRAVIPRQTGSDPVPQHLIFPGFGIELMVLAATLVTDARSYMVSVLTAGEGS